MIRLLISSPVADDRVVGARRRLPQDADGLEQRAQVVELRRQSRSATPLAASGGRRRSTASRCRRDRSRDAVQHVRVAALAGRLGELEQRSVTPLIAETTTTGGNPELARGPP